MKKLRTAATLLTLLSSAFTIAAHATERISLDGSGWTFKTTLADKPEPVTIPHSWPADEKYRRYIGHALYERDFDSPTLKPGQIARLHFDAVYDVAQVWLNGIHLGTHEGGYTPFEFDITKILKPGANHLTIEVDNTPTLTSIPALAAGVPSNDHPGPYGTANRITIVGWMPYGGIVRPASIVISDAVYLRNMKIDAKPDLKTGIATIHLRAWIHNAASTAATTTLQGEIATLPLRLKPTHIAANSDAEVTWTGTLKAAHLWSTRDPFLYTAKITIPNDELTANVGVRDIRVEGTELKLNGRTVHLYGANRVGEDPKEGLRESDAILERDLSDMLADNMRMMRIAHYPQAPYLFDYADKHGMLIIPEAGNWNFSSWQMADPGIRERFKKQMKEMMEQDWNHPSVIAWSVGNEYESYTQQGRDWTRDMRAYTLSLDPTRLITFASRYTGDPAVKTGADEASQYSDFVSINVYGGYAKRFDHVHELYPNKPVFVTEFGKMGEPGLQDPERIKDITTAVNAMKERPYMIGGSLWTWNDYRSLIKGTPANGIRSWGVVNIDREHRDSWKVVQELFKTELP
ncbi:MAG TPA: glycoside hydrolase family 2 TIM barrel-domain containing protein [Edaphobacter sp.]